MRWAAWAKATLKRAAFQAVPTRAYLWLYARDTDRRVHRDPTRASGHPEAAVVPQIMGYVRHLGLEPHHRLLDFGCGTLRTGKHLIEYLDEGRYVGVDISRGAVRYAMDLVSMDEGLNRKRPRVQRVRPFEVLELPWTPDFILCHSVFTHLTPPAAEKTFRQLRRVMGESTTLAFTAFCEKAYSHAKYKDIQYPVSSIVEMAHAAGLDVTVLEGDWGLRQTVFFGRVLEGR